MKIVIASTIVPFTEGGGTLIVDWLQTMLQRFGHQVEVLKLPYYSYWPQMTEQNLALRLLDIQASGDLLIAIRTPSYLLKHPNKVLWFIHHHRGAYDLWGTPYQDIPYTEEGLKVRNAIIKSDNLAFSEAKKIFTNSKIVSKRLKEYNGLDAKVLYPPLLDPERYYCQEYGDFVFYPSRIVNHKRQRLAVEAMRFTRSGVKLVIGGVPGSQDEFLHINRIIEKYSLHDKVKLISTWMSEEQKVELYSRSLCGMYIPYLEDSYGYPSLEAHHAKKAVITCSDSGGTLELIRHEENGLIEEPDPESLAAAMDKLYFNKAFAKTMGEAGPNVLNELGINWENVVRSFTE